MEGFSFCFPQFCQRSKGNRVLPLSPADKGFLLWKGDGGGSSRACRTPLQRMFPLLQILLRGFSGLCPVFSVRAPWKKPVRRRSPSIPRGSVLPLQPTPLPPVLYRLQVNSIGICTPGQPARGPTLHRPGTDPLISGEVIPVTSVFVMDSKVVNLQFGIFKITVGVTLLLDRYLVSFFHSLFTWLRWSCHSAGSSLPGSALSPGDQGSSQDLPHAEREQWRVQLAEKGKGTPRGYLGSLTFQAPPRFLSLSSAH